MAASVKGMRRIKTSYEFRESQVYTPEKVIKLFWHLVDKERDSIGSVVDLGAGDGRFSKHGRFNNYLGVEIDSATPKAELPRNARLKYGCAFELPERSWDAAIGNPPYVRNHYIEVPWMDQVAERFQKSLGLSLNRQANLFVYFLLLGIEITHNKGIVAMVTPYEWVSRPSARPLRTLIKEAGWAVSIYRFVDDVFDGVMTTASITIIDKSKVGGQWNFFEISSDFKIKKKRLASGSNRKVLPYESRGEWWALRGLSPGTQKVFTLTEGERLHHGLSLNDVWPCVTSLKPLPADILDFDEIAFHRYYRDAGERCWLIKSSERKLSPALKVYLSWVPETMRATSTCQNREVWFRFKPFQVSNILVASAFTNFGPKVVKNSFSVHHVGSVYGVFVTSSKAMAAVKRLRSYDFESRVVAHSGRLKKIEVRQLNAVLAALSND